MTSLPVRPFHHAQTDPVPSHAVISSPSVCPSARPSVRSSIPSRPVRSRLEPSRHFPSVRSLVHAFVRSSRHVPSDSVPSRSVIFRPSFCPSVRSPVCPSVRLFIRPSAHPSIRPFVRPSFRTSVNQSFYLSVCLFHPSVCHSSASPPVARFRRAAVFFYVSSRATTRKERSEDPRTAKYIVTETLKVHYRILN